MKGVTKPEQAERANGVHTEVSVGRQDPPPVGGFVFHGHVSGAEWVCRLAEFLGAREVGLLVALLRPSSSGVASRRHEFAGRAYGVRRTVTGIRIGTRRCAFMERKMYRGVTVFSRDGMHQDSSYRAPVPFVGRCEPGCDCGFCQAKAARRASPFFVVYPARSQPLILSDPLVRGGTMLR